MDNLDTSDDDLSFAEIESKIFSARNYVVPSDDLRPRTLEEAAELSVPINTFRKLATALAFVFVSWLAIEMVSSSYDRLHDRLTAPFSQEVHSMAIEMSKKNSDGIGWGLVDVFRLLRRSPLSITSEL